MGFRDALCRRRNNPETFSRFGWAVSVLRMAR
jgi:hypothetical protein